MNRISLASAQGAEIHYSRVGERERDKSGVERIRELEVLLASVKESEKKQKESENSENGRERDFPRRAGNNRWAHSAKGTKV